MNKIVVIIFCLSSYFLMAQHSVYFGGGARYFEYQEHVSTDYYYADPGCADCVPYYKNHHFRKAYTFGSVIQLGYQFSDTLSKHVIFQTGMRGIFYALEYTDQSVQTEYLPTGGYVVTKKTRVKNYDLAIPIQITYNIKRFDITAGPSIGMMLHNYNSSSSGKTTSFPKYFEPRLWLGMRFDYHLHKFAVGLQGDYNILQEYPFAVINLGYVIK